MWCSWLGCHQANHKHKAVWDQIYSCLIDLDGHQPVFWLQYLCYLLHLTLGGVYSVVILIVYHHMLLSNSLLALRVTHVIFVRIGGATPMVWFILVLDELARLYRLVIEFFQSIRPILHVLINGEKVVL